MQPTRRSQRRRGFGGGRFLGPPGGRNGVAARQGIEFDYVHATLQIDDWTFRDVAVRYKGNGSYLRATRAGSDKISLKVDLNKYVKGQKLAGLTTINFQNNITDAGWMNEVLAYRLYRDAGALAPRTTYAQVYLTVDGQSEKRFLGLYSISENVDENFFEERFGTRKGAILKPSTQDSVHRLGRRLDVYNQSYDPKTDLTDAQKARIIELGRLVSGATDEEFAARIGDYVDLDDFARYFAVLVWLANHDSLLQNGQNFYTYLHPDTNRMHFIAWDQDFSFGNVRNLATSWSIHRPWSGNNRFLARLYNVEAFRSKYLCAADRVFGTPVRPRPFSAADHRDRAGDSPVGRTRRQAVADRIRPDRLGRGWHRAVREDPQRLRQDGARARDHDEVITPPQKPVSSWIVIQALRRRRKSFISPISAA